MWDLIIIGSGAGGGPLAFTCARAGLQVLVLEKGPRYPRTRYAHDEIEVLRQGFFTPALDQEPHTVVTAQTPQPQRTNMGWLAVCLGGGTVHMGAFLYRFHPDDFRLRSRFGPFEELADWPYTYEELEPYYCMAEWAVGVSGQGGQTPFEGPRSRQYPMPPLQNDPFATVLARSCRARGLHPFPTPRGINARPYAGRPACTYCDQCAGYGCPVGARGSVQEALIPAAEATGRCDVRTCAMVREVLTDPRGRVTGCVYIDAEGREHRVLAKVVGVCCSALESARLLLLSRSSVFPNGLANSSGLVGRHLQFHAVTMGRARIPRDRAPLQSRNNLLGLSLMDHYFLPKGTSDIDKGGLIRFDFQPQAPLGNADLVLADGPAIPWGAPLKRALRTHMTQYRTLYFEAFHDYIPNRGTYMTLDSQTWDKWGLPVARIHLDPVRHHRLAGWYLLDRAYEIIDDAGGVDRMPTIIGGTSSYLVHGTCRMGTDPNQSVLDPFCRAHDVDNLYVVDGSFMPTSGGAPPTLTILANSFRTADHLVGRFRRGEF